MISCLSWIFCNELFPLMEMFLLTSANELSALYVHGHMSIFYSFFSRCDFMFIESKNRKHAHTILNLGFTMITCLYVCVYHCNTYFFTTDDMLLLSKTTYSIYVLHFYGSCLLPTRRNRKVLVQFCLVLSHYLFLDAL